MRLCGSIQGVPRRGAWMSGSFQKWEVDELIQLRLAKAGSKRQGLEKAGPDHTVPSLSH